MDKVQAVVYLRAWKVRIKLNACLPRNHLILEARADELHLSLTEVTI